MRLYNQKILSQISHLNLNQAIFEWSKFASSGIQTEIHQPLYQKFGSLTHLSIRTSLPLEYLLTRYDLHRCKSLQHLRILVDQGYDIKQKLDHMPLELIPSLPNSLVCFERLQTLELVILPHTDFLWAELLFPALKIISLFSEIDKTIYNSYCTKCVDNDNWDACESAFLESLLQWKIVRQIMIDNKLYLD